MTTPTDIEILAAVRTEISARCGVMLTPRYSELVERTARLFRTVEGDVVSSMRDHLRENCRALAALWERNSRNEYVGAVAIREGLLPLAPPAAVPLVRRHIGDEFRHSRYFAALAKRSGSRADGLPTPELERQARSEVNGASSCLQFLVATNVAEIRSYHLLRAYLRGAAPFMMNAKDVAVLERVMTDELFHVSYTLAEIQREVRVPTSAVEEAFARYADIHLGLYRRDWLKETNAGARA